jgi:hypothetical protein
MDITGPALDIVHLAAGMVSPVRIGKADDIASAVARLSRPAAVPRRNRNRRKALMLR